MPNTFISDDNASSRVTIDTIAFYLWKTATTNKHATPLIFIDIIFCEMWTTIKHNNSIIIVIDLIVLDPTEATFNDEDTFTS